MMQMVRTTITLDPDTAALIDRVMRERGITFKEAVNTAIRRGLTTVGPDTERRPIPTFSMGQPVDVDLDRALRLADQLEDAEIAHELTRGR